MSSNTSTTGDNAANTAPQNGTICWLEIPATDIPRVAAFYNAVLGWTCYQPTAEQGKPSPLDGTLTVHMFAHAGTLHGAFIRMASVPSLADADNKNTAGVLTSFKVDNLDSALNKVVEKGGKVHV